MTDAEFATLFPVTPTAEIAAQLGVSYVTVARRARALGLKKAPEQRYAHTTRPKSAATRAKMRAAQAGRTFTDEARAKMSASRTGKVQTAEHRAHISAANKGKPKPEEWAEKRRGRRLSSAMREARRQQMALRGTLPTREKHYAWKGGISQKSRFLDPRYGQWRMDVFYRDGFTCQDCGCKRRERYLHAHHIRPYATYPDARYELDNGITLCATYHRRLHGLSLKTAT